MKKRRIVGIIFIVLSAFFISFGIWGFISGINSGNVNYIIGPVLGTIFIFTGIGFLIPGLIMTIKK